MSASLRCAVGAGLLLAAALPAVAGRLYVSDEQGGQVVVIDPQAGTVLNHIPVGKRPRGLALDQAHARVYVTLSGSPIGGPNVDESQLPPPDRRFDGIGVVDLKAGKLVATFASGPDPEAFALSHDGRRLYVSNEDTGGLSVVDTKSGKVVAQAKVGQEPEGVTLSADDRTVYVACETSDRVDVLDAHTLAVLRSVPTRKRPRAILLSPDGLTGYVTDELGSAITVFATDTGKVIRDIDLAAMAKSSAPIRPMGIAWHDGRLYVTTGRAGLLLEIDAKTGVLLRALTDVGKRPWGLALDAAGAQAFTANGPGGDVSVIDLASGKRLRQIPAGTSPWGVVYGNSPP